MINIKMKDEKYIELNCAYEIIRINDLIKNTIIIKITDRIVLKESFFFLTKFLNVNK